MKSERYQNDRHFVWLFYLTPDQTPYDLTGLDLTLEVQVGLSKTRITDFTVSGNAVDFVFRGRDQKRPGPILATLYINENQDGMVAIDAPAGLMSPRSTPGAPAPGGVETSSGEIVSFLGEWVDDRLIPNTIARKSDLAEFVTKMVDDLVNYYTKAETYSRQEIEALVAGIQLVPVQVLPEASADTMNKIYLVPSADPKVRNENDEFVTKREGSAGNYTYKWEQIGSTAIDLSGYVTIQALNAALADYTTTSNLTVLLAGKQDVIADLQTIRSGASAGATAYQKPGTGIPKSDLDASAQASLGKADTALQEHQDLSPITDLIPAQASDQNQLADKAFVNSSIETATATFRGTYNLVSDLSLTTSATREQVATALASEIATADNNDYCFVQIPTADATPSEIARVDRYKFDGTAWAYEWSLNNSSFTASQWAAINSGITAALVTAFGNKYDKPSGGIPASDLASAVQTSLGKADTAIQPSQTAGLLKNDGTVDPTAYGTYSKPSTGIPASDLAAGVIPDVSGKENTSNKVTSLSSQSTTTQYPAAKTVYDEVHPTIGSSQPVGGFLPGVVYDLGTLSSTTNFSLATPSDANVPNAYCWTFDTGSTAPQVNFPSGVIWPDGFTPSVEAGKHYEVLVRNNYGSILVYTLPSE